MRLTLAALIATLATPALAEVPKVAADIAPVAGLVARVMQGLGAPETILPARASAHSYDLRPSAAGALDAAQVVFWVGEDLTPWLAKPIRTLAADATVVTLLDTEGTERLAFRTDENFASDDHADDHQGTDPHAWLDPVNATHWLTTIADTLAAADPENADTYRANAAAGADEIAAAATAARALLSDGDPIRYAVAHDAYQYFEHRFGLAPIGAVTLGDAAPPGPSRLARLNDAIAASGATCLLIEPGEGGALPRMLADAGTLTLIEADPMGAAIEPGPGHYPALIAALAGNFAACR